MQPPPLIDDYGEEEQVVEKFLRARKISCGREYKREVLVKGKQFEEPN